MRAALLVAAAEPDGDLARIVKALTERGLGVSELEAAEAAGIVSLDGDRLSFRHPLMRVGRLPRRPAADRRSAHRALAGTLPPDSPSRAWHLARAAVGPDESVASALDAAAAVTSAARCARRRRRARGSWPAGSRRSLPTASAGCGWPPTPSSTRAWRRQRAGSSTAPTPSSPTTAMPTIRSNGSAVSSCAAGCHRRAAAASSRSRASAGRRSRSPASEPGVAVDLLLDALAAYIRDGAFADMASAIEEAVALRDRVDDERARRIDVMDGALRVAHGPPGWRTRSSTATPEMIGARPIAGRRPVPRRGAGAGARLPPPHRGVRRPARRPRGRPADTWRGAPADQRARGDQRRAVRPFVPGDDGGGDRGDRPRREQRHAGAGVAGGIGAGTVRRRHRRPRAVRASGGTAPRRPRARAAGVRTDRARLPGAQPGAHRRRPRPLRRGALDVPDRARGWCAGSRSGSRRWSGGAAAARRRSASPSART